MTLIQVSHSDGTTRRCDARCYRAKNAKCHCVCGGANHGVGLQKALEQTSQMAEAYLTAQLGPDWKVRVLAGHEAAAGQVSAT